MAANQERTDREPIVGDEKVVLRVVVLASGSGTLTQALIDGQNESTGNGAYRIIAVGTDTDSAPVLERARASRIATFVVDPKSFTDRDSWDRALAVALGTIEPDLVVSAGFMRLIGGQVLARFAGRMINSHPAMLPSFPGAHAVRDALAAGVASTGTTVHFIDAGMDTGEIIVQSPVMIRPEDTEETLHERIKIVEREQLTKVVRDLAAAGTRGPRRAKTMQTFRRPAISASVDNQPQEPPSSLS